MSVALGGAVLGTLGASLQLLGYVLFLKSIHRGDITANLTSWSLWAFAAIASVLAYSGMTVDWAKLALPVVCGFCSIAVVAMSASRSSLGKVGSWEWSVAALDVLVIVLWAIVPDPRVAYSALVLDTFVSFMPQWRATWRRPESERPLPWLVWTAAYSCMSLTALLRFEGWEVLAYPLANIIAHGNVWLMASGRLGKRVTT